MPARRDREYAINFGWKREDIISDFMETFADVGYTAKTLSTILVDECDRLYNNRAGGRRDVLCYPYPEA